MTPGADDRTKLAPGRLGLYAERLLDGTELPMFSRQLLDLLTLPLETATAARTLFELVGEDYALTWKVLRLANSFHYNRSNRPIDNLTHAMVVLTCLGLRESSVPAAGRDQALKRSRPATPKAREPRSPAASRIGRFLHLT